MNQRLYKFDNVRVLLIFLVVLGHFLELYRDNETVSQVYRVIYSFHMPLFLFISGYFAKFDKNKVLINWVFPYVLFQFIYIMFDKTVLMNPDRALQFTEPYWILWYLMAGILCYLMIPVLSDVKSRNRPVIVLLLFIGALVIGFDEHVGYFLSLSRFVSFLPYFVMGYYAKGIIGKLTRMKLKLPVMVLIKILALVAIAAASYFVVTSPDLVVDLLRHARSYEKADTTIIANLKAHLVAVVWIFSLLVLMPEKKISFVSTLGQFTLPVYLLHGFVVKIIFINDWFQNVGSGLEFSIVISLIIMILVGNPIIGKYLNKIFTATWLVDIFNFFKAKALGNLSQPNYSDLHKQ